MIVNVNPAVTEFDETNNVLKVSALARDVVIAPRTDHRRTTTVPVGPRKRPSTLISRADASPRRSLASPRRSNVPHELLVVQQEALAARDSLGGDGTYGSLSLCLS